MFPKIYQKARNMGANAKGYVIYIAKPWWKDHSPNLSSYWTVLLISRTFFINLSVNLMKQTNDWKNDQRFFIIKNVAEVKTLKNAFFYFKIKNVKKRSYHLWHQQATGDQLWAIFTSVTSKWSPRGHSRSRSLQILNPCYQVPVSVPK